jgi:uncharacterized protein YyaL (SSP411 family)
MAAGGIHDQLGGGFARYSVDAEWLVPHFEKMLYDNAQLTQLYLDAYLVGGEKRHAAVVQDILDYILQDMTHWEGGFYSAEDADSEGHEGKFYCWTTAELARLLTPEEFQIAKSYFDLTEQGNFVDHSHPAPLPNQNVLSVVRPDISPADRKLLVSAKKKMIEARSQRVRPHLDDKVLASWNGLMLGAMARAGIVLGDSKYLYHRWREGERDQVQLLEGYAFYLSGIIDLYEATLNEKHLAFAIGIAESMLSQFYDSENGGFWQSPAGTKDLILRVKEDYDGAEPSGNSVAILALLKLGKITDRREFTAAAEKSLRLFADKLREMPQAVPYMLQALDFSMDEPHRAVIAGARDGQLTKALIHAVHSVYQPNKVVLGTTGGVEAFAKTLAPKDEPVVYLCTGTACKAPTAEAEQIKQLLK